MGPHSQRTVLRNQHINLLDVDEILLFKYFFYENFQWDIQLGECSNLLKTRKGMVSLGHCWVCQNSCIKSLGKGCPLVLHSVSSPNPISIHFWVQHTSHCPSITSQLCLQTPLTLQQARGRDVGLRGWEHSRNNNNFFLTFGHDLGAKSFTVTKHSSLNGCRIISCMIKFISYLCNINYDILHWLCINIFKKYFNKLSDRLATYDRSWNPIVVRICCRPCSV